MTLGGAGTVIDKIVDDLGDYFIVELDEPFDRGHTGLNRTQPQYGWFITPDGHNPKAPASLGLTNTYWWKCLHE